MPTDTTTPPTEIEAKAADKIEELTAQLVSVEKALNYSLSDAIREGSTVTDQALGAYISANGNMCAMSAALLAAKARHLI